MAPTPITVALISASRSRGTRSSCRWKRFGSDGMVGLLRFDKPWFLLLEQVVPGQEPVSSSQGSSTADGAGQAGRGSRSAKNERIGNLHARPAYSSCQAAWSLAANGRL